MELLDGLKQQTLNCKQRGSGRVQFLALKCDIQKALENGYSVLETWQYLNEHKKISIGYRMFIRYVERFLKYQKINTTTSQNQETTLSSVTSSEPVQVKKNKPKRFEFDAKPKSLDELV